MSEQSAFEPEWAIPPGATIRNLLQRNGSDRSDFAWELDVSEDQLSDLFDGRLSIDENFAARLEKVLGVSADFWLLREAQFRSDARALAGRLSPEDAKGWLRRLPITDMTKHGWIQPTEDLTDKVVECFRFFDVYSIAQYEERLEKLSGASKFRTSDAFRSKPDALNAWLRFGESEAYQMDCAPWDAAKFIDLIPDMRKLTTIKEPSIFLPRLKDICAKCGVALVVAKAPSGCRASGATMFVEPTKALLLLSFRHLSDDHFWFSFFHECGHLILHSDQGLVVEGEPHQSDEIEDEANRFAQDVLLPSPWRQLFTKLKPNRNEIIRFAMRAGVSPGIVVGQLQHQNIIGHNFLNYLKRRYRWEV